MPQPLGEPIDGPVSRVFDLSFSPSGDQFAAAVGDGMVWTWDVTDPERPEHLLTLGFDDEPFCAVEYEPTGQVLVAGGSDGRLRRWPVDVEGLPDAI